MLSISLFVELLRTRPRALFWAMAVLQVVLWTVTPLLFYSAPPGQLPLVLAIGHEFQVGTEFGPPLAFWLAEIVYRCAGLFGVYLLSQVCIVVAFWAVLALGRAIVGEAHAVMAVLLMTGIAVFSAPTPEFGPAILAAPLWALVLLHTWLASQRDDWRYWLATGLEAGLLLLTTYAGLILVGLLILYMMSTAFGRARLETVGPWIAGLVTVAVLFPYLIWLDLGGGTRLIDLAAVVANLRSWGWLVLVVVASHAGLGILLILGRGAPRGGEDHAPVVARAPVAPGGRVFVYTFAFVPIVAMGLFALFSHRPENFVAVPLVVLSGLAAIVAAGDRIKIEHQYVIGYVWAGLLMLPPVLVALAIVIQPWILAADLQVGRPAKDLGQFFGDSFARRTGRPLPFVAGDPSLAALIAHAAPSRPSLYLETPPEYLPRVTLKDIAEKGGIVVWATTDTTGRPPADIAQKFPGLAPEVPQTFKRRFQGRMPLLRVGWGMIRPGTQPVTPAAPEPVQPVLPPPQPVPDVQPPSRPLPPPSQPEPQTHTAPPPVQRPVRPQPQAQPSPRDPLLDRHRPQ